MMRFKDCNECLQAGVAAALMEGCVAGAMDFAPEKVVSAETWRSAFMARLFEHPGERGLVLPWDFPFRIRLGEMTVWSGIEGSGKSTVLNFVVVCLMAQGERALLASLEVKPVESLENMARQVFGGLLYDKRMLKRIDERERTAEGVKEALGNYQEVCRGNATAVYDWLAPKLWIYNHVGIGQWRDLLEDMRWARRRHGITQFVVDNFMRLGIVKDDYAQQAEAITAFAAAALELDCHIHVVVHQNKSEGAKGGASASGKRTVSGAFEIIANAHNIVEVQRDVRKGEKTSEAFERHKIGAISDVELSNELAGLGKIPDGKFILHKSRNGERQNGAKYLWFLWEAKQYADRPPEHALHAPISFLRQGKQPDLPGSSPDGAKELPTTEDLPGQGNLPTAEEMNAPEPGDF